MEDIAMLMSLRLFGEAHTIGIILKEEDQKKVEYLTKSLSSSKYSTNKATYLSWVKYFDYGEGRDSKFQLEAFLAYWLSYFVFRSPPEGGLHS